MDFNFLFEVPLWVYLIIAVLSLFYTYATWNYDYWIKQGIPGNKPNLFMGTLKPLWKIGLHEQDMESFLKYGRTFGGFEGTKPVLYTTDPEIIRAVAVKETAAFPNRRKFAGLEKMKYINEMVSVLRDEKWKSVRNTLSPAFTTGKLKQMVGLIEECVQESIKSMEEKVDKDESMEMTHHFPALTLNVIASTAFGVKIDCIQNPNSDFVVNARKAFRSSLKITYFQLILPKLFSLLPTSILPNPFAYFFDVANSAVDMKLQKGEKSGRRDFLEIMLDAEIPDDIEVSQQNNSDKNLGINTPKRTLTRDSVVGQVVLFLLAGHETTATSLSFMAYELAMNSQVQDKLLAEVDDVMNECKGKITYEIVASMRYLDMVVSETLRLHSPAVRIERMCEQDGFSVNGIKMDNGVVVSVPIFVMHRDPEYYPDPEAFNPERFSPENKAKRNPFVYAPFGVGPRNCIAFRFALMEMKVVMVLILSKFRFQSWEKTEFPLRISGGGAGLLQPVSVNLLLQKRIDQPHFNT